MSSPRFTMGLACAIGLAHSIASAEEADIRLKEAPGQEPTAAYCAMCHSLDYIPMNAPVMTPARWESTVRKMIEKMGAPIDGASAEAIVRYLASEYTQANS